MGDTKILEKLFEIFLFLRNGCREEFGVISEELNGYLGGGGVMFQLKCRPKNKNTCLGDRVVKTVVH